ncbi:MAG: hypothetical protein QN163_01025 [Armatimonadota bacterium]|nr:hypothetical protein [Armatimonadota bacterium]MDR5697645.1 hypothetical protein [Armatimonadota bacterium]
MRLPYREWDEDFEVFGVVYRFAFRGPVEDPPRWEVRVFDAAGEAAVPGVVRGKTEDDARWRAEEAIQTWAAVRRLHAVASRVADRIAPGSEVLLSERATEMEVELIGGWALGAPLLLDRDDVLDPDRTEEEWEAWIEAHLLEHAVQTSG